MKLRIVLGVALTALTLAACVNQRLERPALRMARPSAEPPALEAFAAPDKTYPSVGGDILSGTSPEESAAYQATAGAATAPPATPPRAPAPKP
jgi:hypothetical protein